ncbi:hypothetical protein MJA45_21730 [Paenibacillus aurantius]|uniref:RCK C-terminal domain-containing protein n=1 Tax=Paenibacillus aurantius TaxID=2918900 RepID=A0AA96LBU3_9BACL|nr:hypothetical protein [Paenibacillus aurantius]WNQ10219.1 hypothetical protein MJA45_21730 [Paenibacillus aurantius]
MIIFIVLEIMVTLLIITGLDKEIARFQVVSMLTGTGFTTKESELILRHPVRRKIGVFLILFGAFSLAVIISSMSNILAESFRIKQLSITTGVLALILLVVKYPGFSRRMSARYEDHLQKEFELHELPIQEVLYLEEGDLITAVEIFDDSEYLGHKVCDVFESEEDINLLFLHRGDIKIRGKRWDCEVQEGDILYLYGSKEAIEKKFAKELERLQEITIDEKNAAAL